MGEGEEGEVMEGEGEVVEEEEVSNEEEEDDDDKHPI